MKCKFCGGTSFYTMRTVTRQIRAFDNNHVEIERTYYRCKECYKNLTVGGEDIAPKGSTFHWDVINKVLELRNSGSKLKHICDYLDNRGIKTSMGQITNIYKKYRYLCT